MLTGTSMVTRHTQKELLDSALYGGAALHICIAIFLLTSGVNYVVTADRTFLCIPLFAMVAYAYWLRAISNHVERKAKLAAVSGVRSGEDRCINGPVAALLSLGIVGVYSTYFHPNSISTTISLGLITSSCLAVIGRNFGPLKCAICTVLVFGIPIAIGHTDANMMNTGFYIVLAGLCLKEVHSKSTQAARYVRSLLVSALSAIRYSGITSRRFDVAISSMPNGLIIVDGEGNVAVINASAAEALRIAPSYNGKLDVALASVFDEADVACISLELAISVFDKNNPDIREFEAKTTDGRWLQLEFRKLDRPDDFLFEGDTGGDNDSAAVLIIQDITEKVKSKNELQLAARFDQLTGIANRSWWEAVTYEKVGALRPSDIVALCLLDVDRFKLINDTLGHHIGDQVISGVASRLGSILDDRMVIGRLGGDEFVVMFAGLKTEDEAEGLFNLVFSLISSTYVIGDYKIDVRCSGGVIVTSKRDLSLYEDMSRADMALYKVKRNPNPVVDAFRRCHGGGIRRDKPN
ncbi:sensor domain-containing diguanylate cyclase [Rhizobium sp. MHM7A]|uniref:GGDEF domain-containing protein n=1 Tax=Rhizobium sp. MHM7A TaxID=2583233 RepID=UPI0011062412|nr:sensor domain-containing diguanylate cyclase [Rhizobium sp. MHM7A]TLX17143.1 GGDEF domain-containing protein [Rhizobium sp. MHM7A]